MSTDVTILKKKLSLNGRILGIRYLICDSITCRVLGALDTYTANRDVIRHIDSKYKSLICDFGKQQRLGMNCQIPLKISSDGFYYVPEDDNQPLGVEVRTLEDFSENLDNYVVLKED